MDMKATYLKYLWPLLFVLLALCTACDDDESDFAFHTPIALSDPFILLHDGVYYAYGAADADGIVVYRSSDLKLWKKESTLALHKDNSYGDRWFWAPQVHYSEQLKKFFMYYTVNEHLAVATSDSPLGPFVQEVKQQLLSEKAIDSSFFLDDDGKAYLYYTKFDNGSEIWIAELYDDLLYLNTGTARRCIRVSQSWEVERGTVNEAPFVVKHDGRYYMTYSANEDESAYYGIGYAVSDSPAGPWVKFDENPILQKPNGIEGAGHCSMFRDAGGSLKAVLHAHHSPGNYDTRYMYITDVTFTDGDPAQLVLSKEFQTPRLQY